MNKLEKIFDKNRYIKNMGIKSYQENKEWVDLCDGQNVEELKKNGYLFIPEWVIEREKNSKKWLKLFNNINKATILMKYRRNDKIHDAI